jgi:hypothetical protein
MTLKEIDKRIKHYEKEIHISANILKGLEELVQKKKIKNRVAHDSHVVKIEFFSFVTSSYIDLLTTYKNFKRARSSWERYYHIRLAYLIAYETINTYHKYKGEIYKTVNNETKDIYKRFFDMLNRELADFKYKYDYDNVMPKIRNRSTAHYDRRFLDYYSSYLILNNPISKEIIDNFLQFIHPLHYFTFTLINSEVDELLFVNSWLT